MKRREFKPRPELSLTLNLSRLRRFLREIDGRYDAAKHQRQRRFRAAFAARHPEAIPTSIRRIPRCTRA